MFNNIDVAEEMSKGFLISQTDFPTSIYKPVTSD